MLILSEPPVHSREDTKEPHQTPDVSYVCYGLHSGPGDCEDPVGATVILGRRPSAFPTELFEADEDTKLGHVPCDLRHIKTELREVDESRSSPASPPTCDSERSSSVSLTRAPSVFRLVLKCLRHVLIRQLIPHFFLVICVIRRGAMIHPCTEVPPPLACDALMRGP